MISCADIVLVFYTSQIYNPFMSVRNVNYDFQLLEPNFEALVSLKIIGCAILLELINV